MNTKKRPTINAHLSKGSVTRIAKKLKVSEQTIRNYFSNKSDLLDLPKKSTTSYQPSSEKQFDLTTQ